MRDLIGSSVRAFAGTGHADDELFGLTFNERVRPVLPASRPFTGDGDLLASQFQQALRTHGRTAVHDAIATGLDYLERGRHARRVLVLISDGGDNASASTFEEVAHAATTSHTVIYTITAADRVAGEARPDRLRTLARLTGGTAQQPRNDRDIQRALERVARDIRSSYLVGYVPPQQGAALRHIKVMVRTADQGRLVARTRTEYVRPPE
jgi:Ca-activated chloride channel family protein